MEDQSLRQPASAQSFDEAFGLEGWLSDNADHWQSYARDAKGFSTRLRFSMSTDLYNMLCAIQAKKVLQSQNIMMLIRNLLVIGVLNLGPIMEDPELQKQWETIRELDQAWEEIARIQGNQDLVNTYKELLGGRPSKQQENTIKKIKHMITTIHDEELIEMLQELIK